MDGSREWENGIIGELANPDSDALAPIQKQITDQLTAQVEETKLETKEFLEAYKRAVAERERTGVTLYQRQQQLAQLHEQNEKCDENLETIRQVRREVEARKEEFGKTHERQENDLKKQRALNHQHKFELDKLNLKILEVRRAEIDLESRVKVTRREAYKTEEQMSEVEREKRSQDLIIDRTNQEIRALQKDIHMLTEQFDEQKKETGRAKQILAESKIEKEELEFRKKTLIQQWKSSLVGMQRRDETLEALIQNTKMEREKKKEVENEIEGFKASIRQEKEELEKQANRLMREENKEMQLEKGESEINGRIEQILVQFRQLKSMLDDQEAKLRVAEIEKNKEESAIGILQKKHLKVCNQIREHEKQLLENVSDEVTFKKGTQSIRKEIDAVRSKIRDREIDIANYENEIARIKIDILQTESHNAELEKILKDMEVELNNKLTMIDKYKVEIKKKHDEIEKKQGILDKANRELERLKANQQEENFGPLEAEIHNLQREIIAKEKENEQLNKNWIRQQSELVALMNKSDQISMAIKGLSAKRTILYQQHIRLASKTKVEDDEIRVLKNNVKKLHDNMRHLNELISKHNGLQKELSDENLDLRNRILDRIRTREAESRKLDTKVKGEMREKSSLTTELLEMEKQIMFWEKKIELQLEIQRTLDPEVGQDEIKKMKKEIHIMEQRLAQLNRDTKKKVELMKRAISKKGIIKMKGKANERRKKNTKASIIRDVGSLEHVLKKKKKEKNKRVKEIRHLQTAAEGLHHENQQLDSFNKSIENDLLRIKEEIHVAYLQRSLLLLHCHKDQSVIQDIQRNKFRVEKESVVNEKREKVRGIIEELKRGVPNYEVRLNLIEDYLNSDN